MICKTRLLTRIIFGLTIIGTIQLRPGFADEPLKPFPGAKSAYHGFDRYDFVVDEQRCIVVTPKETAKGRPWIWRAEFFDHRPEIDLALIKSGFHLVYMNVGNTFGCPSAMQHFDKFYKQLTEEHGLSRKPVLEGLSRGGLYVYNWGRHVPIRLARLSETIRSAISKAGRAGKGKDRVARATGRS